MVIFKPRWELTVQWLPPLTLPELDLTPRSPYALLTMGTGERG